MFKRKDFGAGHTWNPKLFERLRQENCKFETSLGNLAASVSK
jgi:hypothetical protein